MSISNLFKGWSGQDWGSLLGGLGGALSAWKQGAAAEELVKLQKQDYNDEKERKNRTQARLDISSKKYLGDHKYDSPSLPIQ